MAKIPHGMSLSDDTLLRQELPLRSFGTIDLGKRFELGVYTYFPTRYMFPVLAELTIVSIRKR